MKQVRFIFKGIAAVTKIKNDLELLNLANEYGATESEHLIRIESVLAVNLRNRLLVLWCKSGWPIGATLAGNLVLWQDLSKHEVKQD